MKNNAKTGHILAYISATFALITGVVVGLFCYSIWYDCPLFFYDIISGATIITSLILSAIGILLGLASIWFTKRFILVASVSAIANLAFILLLLLPIITAPKYSDRSISGAKLTMQLRIALANVTSIEVHLVDNSDDAEFEPIIVTKPEDIHDFVFSILATDSDGITGICACVGLLEFRFMDGTNLLAGLTYHHGVSLRRSYHASSWDGGNWSGNIYMTKESQIYIMKWLEKHDLPKYLLDYISEDIDLENAQDK